MHLLIAFGSLEMAAAIDYIEFLTAVEVSSSIFYLLPVAVERRSGC
jgi:hypothetical protein